MIKLFLTLILFTAAPSSLAQGVSPSRAGTDTASLIQPEGEPFAWGDFTWLNGSDRRHAALLDSRYFTGSFMLDVNQTNSFNHPVDNTVVGSTALARDNEFQVSYMGIGGDFHYRNARGRIMFQLGTRSTVVPRNDASWTRGQFELGNAYRYFSEANAGYHWNTWHGINLDAGIFMSYIGLFSYYNCENWAYQPSFTSDNTPWFFNGLRLQMFPTERLKIEIWLINGWQTYGKFNNLPGFGFQILWRPEESLSFVTNEYIGTDTPDKPGRVRFHSDNSFEARYYEHEGSFIHRAALSITGDLGFESGEGVSPFGGSGGPEQNFISAMAYNRIWLMEGRFGWTIGGGFIHNPGRYLVLIPTGVAGLIFDASPGTTFNGWDMSTTVDWMPDEYQTWRIEIVHREANVPYFAGPGGVTSPDGYTTTAVPFGWMPDQVKSETRIILALLFRI